MIVPVDLFAVNVRPGLSAIASGSTADQSQSDPVKPDGIAAKERKEHDGMENERSPQLFFVLFRVPSWQIKKPLAVQARLSPTQSNDFGDQAKAILGRRSSDRPTGR